MIVREGGRDKFDNYPTVPMIGREGGINLTTTRLCQWLGGREGGRDKFDNYPTVPMIGREGGREGGKEG